MGNGLNFDFWEDYVRDKATGYKKIYGGVKNVGQSFFVYSGLNKRSFVLIKGIIKLNKFYIFI